jgi:hypothetical protein
VIYIGTAVCVNEEGKLLMVLQGKPEEDRHFLLQHIMKVTEEEVT